MQEADGYKQSVIANAEGDASRFKQILVEYEKAPQVTRERMYIDMMQQILSNSSKVLIDQKSGNGSLLYLPLDKLIQSTNPTSAEVIQASQAAKVAEQAATPASEFVQPRVRDSSLGRDREAR
jgi:membrane protease subunit HflK